MLLENDAEKYEFYVLASFYLHNGTQALFIKRVLELVCQRKLVMPSHIRTLEKANPIHVKIKTWQCLP